MTTVLRQRAQVPLGSQYYIAIDDISSADVYSYSDSQFIVHPSNVSALTGAVLQDMGKAEVSSGLTFKKVKFLTYANYSVSDTYVELIDATGTSKIARMG